MGRPKGDKPPKREQKHLWSVAWGPELDAEIEKRNKRNVRDGREDSKSGVAKYLVRQGLRYLDAAEVDPTISARVEAIYLATLAEAEEKKPSDNITGSESEKKAIPEGSAKARKAK